jgi:hypothetical protein
MASWTCASTASRRTHLAERLETETRGAAAWLCERLTSLGKAPSRDAADGDPVLPDSKRM